MISIRWARRTVYSVTVVLLFVSAIAVVAQTTEISSVSREPDATNSILCYPSPKTQTRVSMKTVGDPDVALGVYLEENVLPILRANWYRLISKAAGVAGGTVGVDFSIQNNGTFGAAKVSLPSDPKLDALALKTVESPGAYGNPPLDSSRTSVLAHADFSYEPSMAKPAGPLNLHALTATGQPLSYSHLCTVEEIEKKTADCLAPPQVIQNVEPDYTPEARQHMVHGTVMALVRVGVDGGVQSVCALNSLADGLDLQAVNAVRKWKFQPASYDGKPVSIEIAVETEFHLAPRNLGLTTTAEDAGSSPNGGNTDGTDQQGLIQKGPGVTRPQATYSPAASYTEEARRARIQGDVVLNVTVAETGEVAAVTVMKGLGKGLDENAIEAVKKWKFKPGMKDGKPVRTQIAVQVSFHHL
jgi:TonB family protein